MQKQKLPLSIWLYVFFQIFFIYLFFQILFFDAQNATNIVLGGMYFIEFGVHEASHLVFAFFPSIITAAAGSLGEITFTILIVIAALKGRAYFAAIFGALWVMLAMNSAGKYMADARAQQMQLVGFGDNVKHDWHYVFSQLGWLNADIFIGTIVRGIGDLMGLVALGFGIWLIIQKIIEQDIETK